MRPPTDAVRPPPWWQVMLRRAPWRRSIQVRFSGAALIVATIAVLTVTWSSYRFASTALRERLLQQLNGIADAKTQDLHRFLSTQRRVLEYAAAARPLAAPAAVLAKAAEARERRTADVRAATAAIREELQLLKRGPLAAREVQYVQVPGGHVLVSTEPTSVGRFVEEQEYYREGKQRTFLQNIYQSPFTGQRTLTVATPVRFGAGRQSGVLAAHLDLEQVDSLLRNRGQGLPIASYAINRSSEVVSSEQIRREEYPRGMHSRAINEATQKRSNGAGEYTDYAGVEVIGVWRWISEYDVALLVEARRDEALAPAHQLLAFALGLSFASLVLLAVSLHFVTRRVTRPLLATTAAVERVAVGDFDALAPEERADEVGRLATSVNAMTRDLKAMYRALHDQVRGTERALADAHASRALLQGIIDNTSAAIGVLTPSGQVLLANARFEEAFGGLLAGAAPATPDEPEASRILRETIAAARASGTPIEKELVLGGLPDAHTWLVNCFPLLDQDPTTAATGVVASDLTERARVEEARRHLDAKVQHAQKLESLGVMAGGIAHDFNNILAAVLANADLAKAHAEEPGEVRVALEQIVSATRRASDLTRQMLAYAGKTPFRREIVDLNAIVHDIVPLVRAAQSKKIHWVEESDSGEAWVHADVSQLSQVVLNLLTNAAESIGDEQGRVTVGVDRTAPPPSMDRDGPRDATWHRLSVRDTGRGMDEETRRRIFEPFFTTKESGRGLGLAAVTGIVRSTNGHLDVHSEPGRGTTFEVYLQASDAPHESPDAIVAPSLDSAVPRTVLMIDDEEMLRRVCQRGLGRAGFRVIEAADGTTGLSTFAAHRDEIDVVVLDLTMPDMGGAEVLRAIRAQRPALPVIIASGYDASSGEGGIALDDHTLFLQKPFQFQALLNLLRTQKRPA